MRVILWKLLLTTGGGVVVSRMRVLFLVITGQGLDNPGEAQAHVSRPACS